MPTMKQLVDRWIEIKKVPMEGPRGLQGVEEMVKILNYRDLEEFVCDCSGFIDAFYDWLSEQTVPEWQESLLAEIPEDEKFEDDDDDDIILVDEEN